MEEGEDSHNVKDLAEFIIRLLLKIVGRLLQLAVSKNNAKNGGGIDIIPNKVGGWIRHLAKV